MRPELIAAYEHEWQLATQARAAGDWERAFRHLERAHVLGQRSTRRHVRSHLGMLAVGWRRRDAREAAVQVLRIVAAALMTNFWVPAGNTGGGNVSAFKPMPVPDDLRALLDGDDR